MKKSTHYLTFLFCILIIFFPILKSTNFLSESPNEFATKITNFSKKLDEMSYEDIKSAALKLEEYANSKKGGQIFGGLHDYINSMTKDDFKKYCIKVALNNQEILEENKFNSILQNQDKQCEIDDSDIKNFKKRDSHQLFEHNITPNPLKFGGLHDYIFKKDRKTLIKWVVTAEAHYFISLKMNNEEPSGDWIYKKINEMSNEDMIKFILNMAKKFPEIDSSAALNELSKIYGITDEIVNFVISNNNFEKEFEDSDTNPNESLNITHNKKNEEGQKHHGHTKTHKENIEENHGNLHDYIAEGDRETLIKWALVAEAHTHKKGTSREVKGSLHDYIHKLTNDQIGKYITIAAKGFPELNSREKMEELANEYGISHEIVCELNEKKEPKEYFYNNQDTDKKDNFYEEYSDKKQNSEHNIHHEYGHFLHEYLHEGDRTLLMKWALVSEALLNSEKPGKIIGGLHDYINSLSNEELAKYITIAAKEKPELNSRENMEKLAEKFGIFKHSEFPYSEHSKNTNSEVNKEENISNPKNINDNIEINTQNKISNISLVEFGLFMNENKDDLINWALASEKYDREKHELHRLEGGLEDSIRKLDKQEIVDYIVEKIKNYPELNDKNFLEYLSRSYGFKKS